MNKKSASVAPAESPLSRGLSLVRYLGVRAIPGLVVYRLFSPLFHYRATRCVWVDLEHWRPMSGRTVPSEIRSLRAEEIKRQAELSREDPARVDQVLGAGAEVFGALRGQSIVAYVWISPHPPALNDGFTLEFDERLAYFYRAFTLPEFRGLGLMSSVLRTALESCALRGYRGAVACIDVRNRPSWNAFRSAGFKTIARFRFAKILGRHWMQPSQSQRRPRFRVQRIRSEKSTVARPWSD
jgi:GNAT superfamily N-acetyltransferase